MFTAGGQGVHSWRNETTQMFVLDVFYDPFDKEAEKFAKEKCERSDQETGPNGVFSDFDGRFLWSS